MENGQKKKSPAIDGEFRIGPAGPGDAFITAPFKDGTIKRMKVKFSETMVETFEDVTSPDGVQRDSTKTYREDEPSED
jgi:hypothetical protein